MSSDSSSLSALRGMRVFFSPVMPSQRLAELLDVGEAVAVGRDHGHAIRP